MSRLKSATRKTRIEGCSVVTLVCIALIGLACEPEDESPGLWLRGETVVDAVGDWGFTDAIEEIHIETRPWYGIAHSTTIWCVSVDGLLYVGSYGDEKKRWERVIARRPEARLRIDGKLYEARLSEVSDRRLIEAVRTAYETKYDMIEVFGADVPLWWYYTVTQHNENDSPESG
jgi:hypothetical protein